MTDLTPDDLTARLRELAEVGIFEMPPPGHRDTIREAADYIADSVDTLREVSKTYDNLTGSAVSKPNTLASAVIAEHDERCYFRAERDAALADVARLRRSDAVLREALASLCETHYDDPSAALDLYVAAAETVLADTEEAPTDG